MTRRRPVALIALSIVAGLALATSAALAQVVPPIPTGGSRLAPAQETQEPVSQTVSWWSWKSEIVHSAVVARVQWVPRAVEAWTRRAMITRWTPNRTR